MRIQSFTVCVYVEFCGGKEQFLKNVGTRTRVFIIFSNGRNKWSSPRIRWKGNRFVGLLCDRCVNQGGKLTFFFLNVLFLFLFLLFLKLIRFYRVRTISDLNVKYFMFGVHWHLSVSNPIKNIRCCFGLRAIRNVQFCGIYLTYST